MDRPLIFPTLGAQTGLERRSEMRTNAACIASARGNGQAKVLALFGLRVPIVLSPPDPAVAGLRWLSFGEVQAIGKPGAFVFLGEDEAQAPVFACNFETFVPKIVSGAEVRLAIPRGTRGGEGQSALFEAQSVHFGTTGSDFALVAKLP